jgi:predicted phage-related endonuclease
MLSPAQTAARDGKLTASRVACLMTGDQAEIMNLWREMVGDPDYVPEDLSGVWAVQLGSHTESLNLDWFERKSGEVTRRGEVVTHMNGWSACTLDGWSVKLDCPIECKHVGGREPIETIIARYQAQMHWQMIVTGARRCALSVIMGASEPIVEIIDGDAAYAAELLKRATEFIRCVWDLRKPFAQAAVTAPVKAEKTYDMTGNNSWGANAATWATTRQARKDNEAAEKELKAMVPSDAARCFGHAIEIKRDRAGRLSIKEAVQ